MGRSFWVGRGFLARSQGRGVAPRDLALASEGLEELEGGGTPPEVKRSNSPSAGRGNGTSDRVLCGAVVVATDAGRAGMVQEPQASPDLYFPAS